MNKPQTALECARGAISELNKLGFAVFRVQGEPYYDEPTFTKWLEEHIEAHVQQRVKGLVEVADAAHLVATLLSRGLIASASYENSEKLVPALAALAQFKGEKTDA